MNARKLWFISTSILSISSSEILYSKYRYKYKNVIESKFYCKYARAKLNRRWPRCSACQNPPTVKKGVGTYFFQLIGYRFSENCLTWQTHGFLNSFNVQIFFWRVQSKLFNLLHCESFSFLSRKHTRYVFLFGYLVLYSRTLENTVYLSNS